MSQSQRTGPAGANAWMRPSQPSWGRSGAPVQGRGGPPLAGAPSTAPAGSSAPGGGGGGGPATRVAVEEPGSQSPVNIADFLAAVAYYPSSQQQRGRSAQGGRRGRARGATGRDTAGRRGGRGRGAASGGAERTTTHVDAALASVAEFRPRRVLPPPQVQGLSALPTRARDLAEALTARAYECMSCLEIIELDAAVWTCSCCFGVFHRTCIRLWSREQGTDSFPCPQCRSEQPMGSTLTYKCFCGKVDQPPYDPFVLPHSCGNTCGKRRSADCPHRCSLLCHPGPCAECTVVVGPLRCPCGSTTYGYRCGQPDPHTTCKNTCNKLLSCGQHRCTRLCHVGPCGACEQLVPMTCACGKAVDELRPCGTSFHCGVVCGKTLSCGHHTCQLTCHAGECPLCARDVAVVETCPCGARLLSGLAGAKTRTSCLDPIPCCTGTCGKPLECGRHTCQLTCHEDECPPCSARQEVSCRCRLTRKLVPCLDADDVRCTRLCGTRLSCGRHYCREACCPDRGNALAESHRCLAVCGTKLPCGHVCQELCHAGACPPCVHFTTETLYCACGRTSLPPPQPCGTVAPRCPFLCGHTLPCGHTPEPHHCHTGDCPPCQHLVPRVCVGGHHCEVMVPCAQPAGETVCEQPCARLMTCGHRCTRTCHSGPCDGDNGTCQQTCSVVHASCGHVCGSRCHYPSDCPRCSEKLRISCSCGNLSRWMACWQVAERRAASTDEQDADNDASPAGTGPEARDVIPCDDSCFHRQRLSALAGLAGVHKTAGTEGEGGSGVLGASTANAGPFFYSPYLWERAATDQKDIRQAESRLRAFVEGSESLVSLPPASKEKRALYHALAFFYGVQSESYDEGANRSVLLTKEVGRDGVSMGSARVPPISLLDARRDKKCDPNTLYASVMEAPMDGPVVGARSGGSKKRTGTAGDGPRQGKSRITRAIHMIAPFLSEVIVAKYLVEMMGSFVYGGEVHLGETTRATLVFTSLAKQQEGYTLLRKKAVPFKFWVPEE